MDVFDSYFRTLRIFLPKDQRDDIIRELSEEIRSQVADKEAALGRPLNATEQSEIISQYGHPLLTAARYRPQHHLIGPVVFPYYWIILKVVLGLIVVGHLVGAMVMLANGALVSQSGAILESVVGSALAAVGWLTALAAFIDFWLSRSGALEKWKPRISFPRPLAHSAITTALASLPGARHKASSSAHRRAGAAEPSVSGFVISVVISVWWLAGLKVPYLFFGSGAANLEWGPAMNRLYPVLVIGQLTMLVEQFVRLRAREDTGVFRVTRLAWLIGGWALIYLVATSDHQWMVWHGDAGARLETTVLRLGGRDISVLEFVNYVWSTVFVLAATAGTWQSLSALRRRFRGNLGAGHRSAAHL